MWIESPHDENENDAEPTEKEVVQTVRVIPRRKAGEPRSTQRERKEAIFLTKELLSQYFGIPVPEVAALLGIGATALKVRILLLLCIIPPVFDTDLAMISGIMPKARAATLAGAFFGVTFACRARSTSSFGSFTPTVRGRT